MLDLKDRSATGGAGTFEQVFRIGEGPNDVAADPDSLAALINNYRRDHPDSFWV